MNWFDIFAVILLLRTGYIGFKNGLSLEIYKAAGLIISGLAAFYFYKKLVLFITQSTILLISDSILNASSFLTILFICMLLLKFVFMFTHKVTQLSFAKNFNTTAGMLSGLARGSMIVCLVFAVLSWSAVDYIKKSIQEKSFSGPYIVRINSVAKNIVERMLPRYT